MQIEKINDLEVFPGQTWVHKFGLKYEILNFSPGVYYDVDNYENTKIINGPFDLTNNEKGKIYYIQLDDGEVMKKGTKYIRSKEDFLKNFKKIK